MAEELKGMKQAELVALGSCGVCHKKIGDSEGLPVFYVVEISRAMLDRRAIRRNAGLEMMLGSPAVAAVMGTDEDMAKFICEPKRMFVHDRCADKTPHLAMLLED